MKQLQIVALMLVGAAAAGCGTMPMTADEFTKSVQDGGMLTRQESYVVQRPLASVFQDVQHGADKCFNVDFNGSMVGQYGVQRSSLKYRSKSRMKSKTTGQMAVQDASDVGGKMHTGPAMPEGGYYYLVANVDAMGNGSTRVSVYGTMDKWEKMSGAIRAWSGGNPSKCPW